VTEWQESSVVVRSARWLGRESLVAGMIRGVWRRLRAFDAAVARAAADKDGHGDDERLRAVLRGSKVFNAVDRLFAAPALAWEDSRTRGAYESTKSAFLALPLWQRVRLIGWMVLVALTTRIALYLVSRAPVTAVTVILWALVALAGALMMLSPRPVAAAWTDWRARRARGA
jgi:hypothetical protein